MSDEKNYDVINEENLKKLEAIEKAIQASRSTFKTEAFVDGTYSPSVTLSTNDETEYVTVTFTSVGIKAISVVMSKKQFKNFTQELTHFANAFLYAEGTGEKQLIKG